MLVIALQMLKGAVQYMQARLVRRQVLYLQIVRGNAREAAVHILEGTARSLPGIVANGDCLHMCTHRLRYHLAHQLSRQRMHIV